MKSQFVVTCALVLAAHANAWSQPAESGPEPAPPRTHYWQSLSDARGQLGLIYLSQSDDDPYRGFTLSSGLLNEFPIKRGFIRRNEMESFLSARKNADQTIWTLGFSGPVPYALAWGPSRLLARCSVGLEYRADEPDHGLGVLVGLGAAAEVWLGRNVLFTFGIERQYAYPGNDSNQLGVGLRFVGSRLPMLVPMV